MTGFTIPATHPSLPGHFPGHPVVPAVVILDEVADCFLRERPGLCIVAIDSAKFTARLLPEENCRVCFTPRGPDRWGYQCRVGERVIASGLFRTAGASV